MIVKIALPLTYAEEEIQFPRYAEAVFGDYHTSRHFRKVTEAGGRLRSVQVILNEGAAEIEINENMLTPEPRNVDFVLGRGEYESTESAFESALSEARGFFSRA